MDLETYRQEHAVEAHHWWFVGRRRLFGELIRELQLDPDSAVVDVGSSSGTNLRLLRELGFTRVWGVDMSPVAAGLCREKGLPPVIGADATSLPFRDRAVDMVLATDLIEHVRDDRRVLEEVRRVLKCSGYALVTVPRYRALWGWQDEVSHHLRRYEDGELGQRVRDAGFRVVDSFHFNYVLLAPIFIARRVMALGRALGRPAVASENQVNAPMLNAALGAVFSLDVSLARLIRAPFGVSELALLQRTS